MQAVRSVLRCCAAAIVASLFAGQALAQDQDKEGEEVVVSELVPQGLMYGIVNPAPPPPDGRLPGNSAQPPARRPAPALTATSSSCGGR